MKKCLVPLMVLVLWGCTNNELKHELAGKTNKVEALTSENEQLKSNLDQVNKDLEALRLAAGDAEALQQELETLRARAEQADKLEKKLTELDEAKKTVSELKGKLREVGVAAERLDFLSEKVKGVKATIVTNQGSIDITFFHDLAPIHCFNFITRAESGYYDKTQFHRVIPGFMIQGGDANSKDMNFNDDGGGGTIVSIPHEFNSKNHTRGVLSMARRGDTRFGAGSQFFVMHGDNPGLNNQYTVFGEVTSGMDVVDKIAKVNRNRRDHPLEPVWIETIKVFR